MTLNYLNIMPLLKKHGIKPKKSLGQNFLIEASGLAKVIQAAEIQPSDHVLEIGAGLGSLTVLLAQVAEKVTAVEIDQTFFPPLSEALSAYTNVNLIQGDILELKPSDLVGQNDYIVVANIPYYITSAILRHLLDAPTKPSRLILTIQREVAERIVAREGKMSLLSLSVQVFGQPEITSTIPAGCFLPAPDVDSAVLRIELYPQPLIETEMLEDFFTLARAGFSQKRKTLRNSISGGLRLNSAEAENMLAQAGIDPQRRAETLNLQEWGAFTLAYRNRN